ncbi:MAG: DUF2513 domain-containing protein [Phycisphaerales bacterium]|nr:DUF2513 domain-containing protein [Phycisphaerales bacterium]
MKRDLDLIRKILQICEEAEYGFAPHAITVEGYTDDQIGFHIYLAGQAGLMLTEDVTAIGERSPAASPVSLTWQGYEFLEASRDDGIWSKAKRAANASGGLAFDVVKSVLITLTTVAAKKALGLG